MCAAVSTGKLVLASATILVCSLLPVGTSAVPTAFSPPPSPAKKCDTKMQGDIDYETCMVWCREKQDDGEITNHCAFCKCRTCPFWNKEKIDACQNQMALKLQHKWRTHNSSHTHKKKESQAASKDGPRDERAIKKLNEWLGIKPKVPAAWQKLEEVLSSGANLIRPRKKTNTTKSSMPSGHG
mmetsp:Transcript_25426/g.54043  ORF Transcript_25426/g.54043 Transcript_25426/m.54043 type:complete len:183 (+) Transcript_25426:173-721(+)